MKQSTQSFCKKAGISEEQFYGKEKISGDLYLGSVTSIPEGFNPTVGGGLYLGSDLKPKVKINKPKGPIDTPKSKLIFWRGGKYIKADGMFTEVVSKKGNVYKVKKLNSTKEFYLVSDGETHAHGETLKQAKQDYQFKLVADKLKKDPIKENTVITTQYYRIITGACEFGVKNWIDRMFSGKNKEAVMNKGIKAKDLLPLLQKDNAYGFERFKSLLTF